MSINVRTFTRASSEYVFFGSGSWDPFGVESLLDSPFSMAAIVRLTATGLEQILVEVGASSQTGAFFVDSSNRLAFHTAEFGVTAHSDTLTLSSGVWYLVGVTGNKGSSPDTRFHRYNYDTATWTHINGNTTMFYGNNDATTFEVGGNWGAGGPSGFLGGDVLIFGISPNAISDADFETLEDDGTGGTFTDWLSLMGTVWRFNQAAVTTNVNDLDTFGANQTSRNGTSVSSVTEPLGWGEDAAATGKAPPFIHRPNHNYMRRRFY